GADRGRVRGPARAAGRGAGHRPAPGADRGRGRQPDQLRRLRRLPGRPRPARSDGRRGRCWRRATFWTGTRALIAEVARPGERRSWFALQTAIRSAGYGLGGLAGAAAVSVHSPAGFRALAALDAVSYLAAAVLLLFWRQPPPAAQPAKPPAPGRARCSYRSALTDRPLAGITALNTAFVLCAQVLTVVLAVYVVGTLHLAAWIAGMLFALNTVLVAAGQAPLTLVTRRIPHRHVLRGAAATWAAAFGLLCAAAIIPPGTRPAGLAAAITIFTLAALLRSPVITALCVE